MADYRTRNQLLLAALQSGPGVEGAPASPADAIKAGTLTYTPTFEVLDPNYSQAGISHSAPTVGGGTLQFQVPSYLRGSGTPGTAPDIGRLLRACSFQETLTAADVIGTAQAGGASTITLAVGASAVDNIFVGMPITIASGLGAGQERVVSGYVGSTKIATVFPPWDTAPDNTSHYAIVANARYKPISNGQELVTLWGYAMRNAGLARRRRIIDAMGTFTIDCPPRGIPAINFTFSGWLPGNPDDVSAPTLPNPYPGPLGPPAIVDALTYLGAAAIQWSGFSYDAGHSVAQYDDPSTPSGYSEASIVDRAPTGQITPNMTLIATRDVFADWRSNTTRAFWLRLGKLAGNRVSLYVPQMQFSGHGEQDVRGFLAERLDYRAVAQDSEMIMAFY